MSDWEADKYYYPPIADKPHDPPRLWTEFELRVLIEVLTRDLKNEIAMLHAKVRHLENDG